MGWCTDTCPSDRCELPVAAQGRGRPLVDLRVRSFSTLIRWFIAVVDSFERSSAEMMRLSTQAVCLEEVSTTIWDTTRERVGSVGIGVYLDIEEQVVGLVIAPSFACLSSLHNDLQNASTATVDLVEDCEKPSLGLEALDCWDFMLHCFEVFPQESSALYSVAIASQIILVHLIVFPRCVLLCLKCWCNISIL